MNQNNILNILKSWIISFNPTSEQQKLAQDRVNICNNCSNLRYLEKFDTYVCNECMCPISKIIFSPQNKCKANKWKN